MAYLEDENWSYGGEVIDITDEISPTEMRNIRNIMMGDNENDKNLPKFTQYVLKEGHYMPMQATNLKLPAGYYSLRLIITMVKFMQHQK